MASILDFEVVKVTEIDAATPLLRGASRELFLSAVLNPLHNLLEEPVAYLNDDEFPPQLLWKHEFISCVREYIESKSVSDK